MAALATGGVTHAPDEGCQGVMGHDRKTAWVWVPCTCGSDDCQWVGSASLTQYVTESAPVNG